MKFFIFISLLGVSCLGHAASKSPFSVFGFPPTTFAEATCTGLKGHPPATTVRLNATDLHGLNFEFAADLVTPYKVVVSASSDPNERTLFLTIVSETSTPITASTVGLEADVRISSSIDVECELNSGAQITK